MILNKSKKIIIINLIIMFILSIINLNQISFANTVEIKKQGEITVSNIENGVKVELYQIATIEFDDEANQPKDEYNWTVSVGNWINTNMPEYSKAENLYKQIESNSKESQAFYDRLISAIKNGEISIYPYDEETSSGIAEFPVTEENLDGNITFSNVDMGTYIVIIEDGYMVYTPSVVNMVPNFDVNSQKWNLEDKNVVIKASKPTITKSVTRIENTIDNLSTADNIYYTISSDVPVYLENSISKKYEIRDEMDKSVNFDENSICVLGYRRNGGELAEAFNEYTIEIEEISDKKILKISFNYEEIKKYSTINVEYIARLVQNKNLVVGKQGNNNIAYLEYSNNPYKTESTQTQISEKVTVYTYGIEVKSVDKENTTLGLPGSEFNIIDSKGEKLYFVKGDDSKYYVAKQEDENAVINLNVNELGELSVKGLDAGVYTLKQVKAPDGYNISSKNYMLNLEDNNLDGELDDTNSFMFLNSKGFTLPVTGGKGTTILIISGTIFIGIGLILIISIYKKRKILENK